MNENKEVFQQMKDNKNVLHITELLLITLFFNATLHRMFGWVNSVKADFDNWLSQEYIDHCFKKVEEV